ncbi:MAG TPA: MASE4 domain-containing protein [Terriglobales bacterium]|nr:MASE4 domain-containing protein [Terriglobales bacterium]
MIGPFEEVRTRDVRATGDSIQSRAVERPADGSPTDFPAVITAMPINAAQRRFALGIMTAILLIELASAPFAYLQVVEIDSFIPAVQSVMFILHLITAVLLFSQYSVRPRFAMLALASGYVFSGLFAFEQMLAFPGAFSKNGLIGNADSPVWLFVLWQTAFPLAAIVYALSKDTKDISPSTRSPAVCISIAVACVVAATGALTLLLLIGSAYLPKIFLTSARQTTVTLTYLNIYMWLLNSTALVFLFIRRRTILDLWMMVTLFAWWPLFLVPMYFTVVRFSVGWYVARCLATLASSALLAILLGEITLLYARLANSVSLSRRERAERLASVEAATSAMAHEIRQPLAGIATSGAAGLNWLAARPANIERTRACLTAMVNASHHAEEIISGIGRLFRRLPNERTMVQLNDVCREVLSLVQHDVLANGISVRVRCRKNLPLIHADHTQLQQVILNLVSNAIDAMNCRPAGERRLRLWTSFDGKSTVSLCVRDSGPGVPDYERDRIFEPFYTTKSNGTGLGLAICRTIIEEHGGALRLAETSAHGSMFEVVLPPVDDSLSGLVENPLSP